MSTNTTILQGRFTSTGSSVLIPLVSGVTWMNVYNITQVQATNDAVPFQWYWQYGFPAHAGLETSFVGVTGTYPTYSTSLGFTLVDTSAAVPGTIHTTITAVSTASIPVATNTSTNGLVAGNIVRMINVVGAPQLSGLEFTVGYNTLSTTTFSLDYMSQLSVAGTTASWVLVPYDPIFYPRRRTITKITRATQAVVTLSVTHGYKVGQLVRMSVPSACGMTQMNGLQATIVAINTTTTSGNTITLNIDSSAFTAFVFPLAAGVPFTPAEVVPMGEDTAYALSQGVNVLSDATINQSQIGLLLDGSAGGPAGAANDVIYWTAGQSFNVDNQ